MPNDRRPKWVRDGAYERTAAERMDRLAAQMGVPPEAIPPKPRAYQSGDLRALMGRESVSPIRTPEAERDYRWHISVISYAGGAEAELLPTWEDMVWAAHGLRPGVTFVIGIPAESHWMISIREALHLWELHDENLEGNWIHQARVAPGKAPA